MRKSIARIAILALVVLHFGCAEELNNQSLTEPPEYADLSGLIDENYFSMDQITQIQDSDDETLDVENPLDQMSNKDKIIIVGDSWATFPCLYNSMGKMIGDRDANLKEDNRCLRTTKLGITAGEWVVSKQHQRVIKFLKETPRLKYLYLSLGGNDLMAVWNKNFTREQELVVYKETAATVKKIMEAYLSVRPDLKIILSGYDFPNFTPNHKIGLYRNIFERMGSPTPERLNPVLVGLCQYMAGLRNNKNIFYIQHIGLAHYYDGNEDKRLSPEKTLSPGKISPFHDPTLVGGSIKLPSSKKSMINWLFIIRDAFHLNTRMYRKVMWHTYDNLLVHILPKNNKQVLAATAN
jgi:hypothetical protein